MINRHEIDFEILDDDDTKSLCFLDKSDYFKRPEKPIIEVKFPNINKVYSLVIDSCGFKKLTTENLCYLTTVQDFSDGIYDITYSVAPHDKIFLRKKFIKTSFLKKEIKEILKDFNFDQEKISLLYKIDLYLQSAQIAINSDESLGVKFYNEAKKLLNSI
jgi:hypothetical protein